MNNEQLLENISVTYNHTYNTSRGYKLALTQYAEYFNMSLQELLDEAENEENKSVKWKHSQLKIKLLKFRQYLIDNFAYNTAKIRMSMIIKFYKFYDIEVYPLPKINKKSVKKVVPIYYKNLPDKEIIREAINIANPLMKSIILFGCSSGCGRTEILSLTIQNYIDALSEYLPNKKMDIYEIIDLISGNDQIIPTFNILRRKTNKYYITYCSPEAVKAINSQILSRTDNVTNESRLFKISQSHFNLLFKTINDELGLGTVGEYGRFRSHMLRKFHASALYNDGMSIDKVNDLQGKAKNKTDASYFMTNPDDLKYEYIQHLSAVTISKEVEKISIKSPEFAMIENENKELRTELSEMRQDLDTLKDFFDIGD